MAPMSWHGWLIFAMVALPLIGFLLWIFGQFLRARREETETVLRKGLPAQAEIIACAPGLRGDRSDAGPALEMVTVRVAGQRRGGEHADVDASERF